ncbi:MAG: benzoate-CoA ligase family protein [Candidatus Rokubacteria bacterium]|nr:benzoate-CoA ligase family protein [Candidatus Rokubacteria bacterium]MBI4254472.1 benzoate-CoA ligase family protein [Candidatus Rokubacteria bacterium]
MIPDVRDSLPPPELWPERVYTLPELRYPLKLNLGAELLDANAEGGRAGRPAIHAGSRTLTYGELAAQVNQLCHGLRSMGLDRGDRVLLRLPNVPEFIVSWLACQKLGIVVVATMPMLRARELAYVAGDAGTKAAIVWGALREELERAQPRSPVLKRLIVAGEARAGDTTLASLMSGESARFTAVATDRDEMAMIAYTSGSTGVPKGCVHVHRDFLASADSYARHVLAPSPEDRFGGHPTLAFTFGTGGLLIFPFRFGAATVLSPPFTPEGMLGEFARQRVTVSFCAPTSYRLMLGVPDLRTRFDLGSLRLGVSAAEPLPAATWEEWHKATGIEILDGIGSTEMTHIFISSVKGRVRPGATGVPVTGYDCRVVDETGREVPPGQPGLVAIKGPTGCKYWRKPDRQAEYVRFGGWNVTGDVYVRDEDGYFFYQCRSDDMIVSGGYKIPGPEVEHVLDEHPAVAESAVVAAPDATRGFIVKAFVVLKPGRAPGPGLVTELQEHVKRELAPYKYPRAVAFVEKLPRTETGKIQRFVLRQSDVIPYDPKP